MKDTEIRWIVLQAFYEQRRSEKKHLEYTDLSLNIPATDFLRCADQLHEHGLIHWIPLQDRRGQTVGGAGHISADGVDAIESGGQDSPIRLEVPVTQNIHISNAQGIQVGNHNTLNLISALEGLVQEIEESDASAEEKNGGKRATQELRAALPDRRHPRPRRYQSSRSPRVIGVRLSRFPLVPLC